MPFSASALERYTYCPLSWHLARQGVRSEGDAAREGHAAHARKGRLLRVWDALGRVSSRAFDAAVLFTLVASSAVLVAIDLTLVAPFGPAGLFLLLLSLLCLLAALAYLFRSIATRARREEIALRAGILEGTLEYSDLDRPADLLAAPRYDLVGKPDYVVRREGQLVPVEVKSGKAPERPHESHVVQCAAYCLLVHESTGERPPYGVISYPDRSFEVPYDDAAERRVLVTLLRMRLAEATGEVHRDHEVAAKCRGCSRRDACAERLA